MSHEIILTRPKAQHRKQEHMFMQGTNLLNYYCVKLGFI